MPRDAPTSVLVIDDDEAIRRLVGSILTRSGYSVLAAAEGQTALAMALERSPDFIILDLSMPGLPGQDVCAQLRTWYRGPILVLSGNGEESTIIQVLDRGADDYLTKPFRSGVLLARMRALLRRASTKPERASVIVAGALSIDLAKRRVLRDEVEIRLTRTEFDILAFLARNIDRVVTSEMILRQVWGPHHGEYAQTLRVHIGHIRKKIETSPGKPEYVLTQAGVGYRFTTPPESTVADAAGV